MTTKIYLDVSHIIGWSGNLTGVERVEYHLIKHYFDLESAHFIQWEDGNFVLVDRDVVENKIINYSQESQDATQYDVKAAHRVVRLFKKKPAQKSLVYEAGSSDTVIVPAGLWDKDDYINGLKELATKSDVVHVVHDMIPILFKQCVVDYLPAVFEKYMLSILPGCRAIIANSESTARDTKKILKQHKLNAPPVEVYRLGDTIDLAVKAEKPKMKASQFVLSVGTIEVRKNYVLLYYAVKRMLELGMVPPTFVIVGRRGWLTDNLQYMIDRDDAVRDYLVIMDNVSDNELRWLYEHCLFTVFASVYEGWGLPVGESLSYGKVTLSSRLSSMPEIGGKNADYFSPYSVDELMSLVTRYMKDDERSKREKQIKGQYKRISWEASSKSFDKALRSIYN